MNRLCRDRRGFVIRHKRLEARALVWLAGAKGRRKEARATVADPGADRAPIAKASELAPRSHGAHRLCGKKPAQTPPKPFRRYDSGNSRPRATGTGCSGVALLRRSSTMPPPPAAGALCPWQRFLRPSRAPSGNPISRRLGMAPTQKGKGQVPAHLLWPPETTLCEEAKGWAETEQPILASPSSRRSAGRSRCHLQNGAPFPG